MKLHDLDKDVRQVSLDIRSVTQCSLKSVELGHSISNAFINSEQFIKGSPIFIGKLII